MLTVKIDGLPPSVNHCYVSHRVQGKRYKSKQYVQWEEDVEQALCKIQDIPIFVGTLSVEIELHAPDWFTLKGAVRKKDAGNFAKTAVDALFKHLIIDDSYIFDERIVKVASNHTFTVIRVFDLGAH